MLNYCIQRKKEHYENSSKPLSTSSSSASEKGKFAPHPFSRKLDSSIDAHKQSVWEVDSSLSDSDEEFFEAVEEPERVSENSKNECGHIISQKDSKSQDDSPSGSFFSLNKSDFLTERTGVLNETDMLLLETGEPLCIPVTQVSEFVL